MTAGTGLGVVACDSQFVFYDLCKVISDHDRTGIAGPVVVHGLAAIGTFLLVYIAGRIVRRIVDVAMTRAHADVQVCTLFHNVGTAIIWGAALFTAIVVAGVNVAVFLTAAGVTTIAIGLAFQDVLRNILAGIWLLLERPFRLGDNIAVLEYSGVVQTITLRTTTLKTADGRLAVVPNLTVFANPVLNASTFQLRQFSVGIRLPDDADFEAVFREARGALQETRSVAARPAPTITPVVDGEKIVLRCGYWIDQTAQNPDIVAAEVARRVWEAVQPQRRSTGT